MLQVDSTKLTNTAQKTGPIWVSAPLEKIFWNRILVQAKMSSKSYRNDKKYNTEIFINNNNSNNNSDIMIIKSERKRTIIAYIFAGLTNCNTKWLKTNFVVGCFSLLLIEKGDPMKKGPQDRMLLLHHFWKEYIWIVFFFFFEEEI